MSSSWSLQVMEFFTNANGHFANQTKFEVLLVAIVIILFFTFFLPKNYGFAIILIVFSFYIASLFLQAKQSTVNDYNTETLYQQKTLQNIMYKTLYSKQKRKGKVVPSLTSRELSTYKLDSLHIDSNLIHFLYSIRDIAPYNPEEYIQLLKGTNNILKIRKEIEIYHKTNGVYPENIASLFEISLNLRSNTINNMHNFIYSTPKSSEMYHFIEKCIEQYSLLISRHTDIIHKYHKEYNASKPMNIDTKIIVYNTTKPYDALQNAELTPTKSTLVKYPILHYI